MVVSFGHFNAVSLHWNGGPDLQSILRYSYDNIYFKIIVRHCSDRAGKTYVFRKSFFRFVGVLGF